MTDVLKAANIEAMAHDPDVAHIAIDRNRVISSRKIPGFEVELDEHAEGVRLRMIVREGVVISKPAHLCFGVLAKEALQRIEIDFTVEPGGSIPVVAHCVFPAAREVRHIMDARITVAEGASYSYFERHIHSDYGGVIVVPKAQISLGRGARFRTEFELLRGRVGLIDIDYETTCGERSVMEMTARISGSADDLIKIRETGLLAGAHSTGVLTSRVAVRGKARAEVFNKLIADAPYARGHVDCKEIVQDEASANAVPIVEVRNPRAHVTHEAAIGSVDSKQLETLMSRGLTEDEASDLIIQGLLS